MSGPVAYDAATMAGALKERYGERLVEFLPASTKLRNSTIFDDKNREGNKFNQMVTLSHSGGFTYAGAADITTAYDLNDAIPAVSQNATVQATEIVGAENIGYGMTYKAQGNDLASFVDAQEYAMKNLVRGTAKRLETMFWYGGAPLATQTTDTVQSAGIGCAHVITYAGSPATTAIFTISLQSWAPGIWGGSDTNLVDAVNITVSGGAFTSLSVINGSSLTISKINMSTRQVTLTGTAADLTAIAAIGADNVVFYWQGAFNAESLGVQQILSATSGSLFGITIGTYSLWDPIQFDCSGAPLSFSLLVQALDQAVSRGLEEDVTVFVPSVSWTDMMNDLAALRRFDSSYKPSDGEQGMDKLVFHGQSGKLTIESSLYVKTGNCAILGMDNWSRKGSTEITLSAPNGMPFVFNLPQNAGYQIRDFAAESMFCQMPSRNVWMHNIGVSHAP